MDHELKPYGHWGEDPEWMHRIDIDELERLAGIGYRPEQIAMYFKVSRRDFLWYFNLIGSPLQYHYERGQLKRQATEGIRMTEAAERGNLTQALRLDKLRKAVSYRNSINKIFFDDIG